MTTLAVINRSAPYGCAHGQESLDLVLAAASFGQNVSVFFIDDGVFQLIQDQQPENIEHKNYSKTFAALEFYDVEDIYVCKHSLSERCIDQQQLCIDAEILEPEELCATLARHQHLLSF